MALRRRRGLWLAVASLFFSLPHGRMAVAAEPIPQPASDPVARPSQAPEITLETLLAHAETHAPVQLLGAANSARIRAARAAAGNVVPENPELWIGVGPRVAGARVGVDFAVGVSQRFELGGERAARLRVADAVKKGIEAESRDRRWVLHTTLHALFYKALVARERVVLAERIFAFQEEIATIVGKQRKAGQVSQLNERVAQAESATARQELTALMQAELALRQELALVAGWAPDAPPVPKGALTPVGGLPPLIALIARAAERRPDLAVLDAAVTEARAQIRAADRDKSPEPVLGLAWTRESAPVGGDATHVIIATVGMPLPFASNNEPARAQARAALEIAQAERQRAAATIGAEVTRAYLAALAATRRLEAFGSEVLPRFEENLAALKRAYELGEIDILGLASGRERFLEAKRDALTAQEDYFTALAALEQAVGIDVIDAPGEDQR